MDSSESHLIVPQIDYIIVGKLRHVRPCHACFVYVMGKSNNCDKQERSTKTKTSLQAHMFFTKSFFIKKFRSNYYSLILFMS